MNHAKNFGKRTISLILAVMMVLAIFPMSVFAANVYNATETGRDTTKNQVRVIVENNTYTDEDAPWSGRLVDQWVDIDNDSTMMSAVVDALNGYEQEGADSGYISSINELSAFDGGFMSGWMGTLNDWFTSEGFDAFTVANGKLTAGDIIDIMYTCDYGDDLGGSWDNNNTSVKAISFSAGTLDKSFAADLNEYTLTVPANVESIYVEPTATNKNFQVRTFIGETEYKRTALVPVANGTVITVKCGDKSWPSMNTSEGAHTYTFVVVKENNAPKIKESVQNPLAADVYVNSSYELDLSEIFEGEDLTYKVSVDSGEYTEANEKYSYTPESAGEKVLNFKAVKGSDESEAYTVNLNVTAIVLRTVTVDVFPKTVNVVFKSGETALASEVEDKGVVSNAHRYVLTVPAGEYSYIGTDGEANLGGEIFTVSDTEDAQTLRLLRVNIRYNGSSLSEGDYTFTLKNGEKEVVYGTPYVSSNIRYTPTLLIAGVEHKGETTLKEERKDEFYLTTNNGTFSNTPSKTATSAQTLNLPISQYKMIRVTAPKDATTTFYKQDANYVVEPVTPDSSTESGDNITYQFKGTAAHSNYQFRSMKDGKVTQAGYLADGNNITVTFPDRAPSSTVSTMDHDDKSVLLNVSAKNELNLKVGDTFKLRAFRAAWEIINTTTANQMIEPDFHYQILSGSDVISIVPTTEATNAKFPNETNGNATGNWMNIKAEKAGTAIVAVYYDAIDVYNANPPAASAFSTFGATDPSRYGIFVVTVGDDENITWNPASQDGDWDAEFDTVYYVGDNGVFTFKPIESVNSVTVRNVLGTDLGTAQTVTAESDGSYKVPVTTGANIITVETANGTDYQIVRAKKINYYIKNNTTGEEATNGAPAIKTGDSVTISFDKLDMPIPKMSGVYNPGYMSTAKTAYVINDMTTVMSEGTQYDFSSNSAKNSVTFTAHFAGTNNLKGYISLSSMGDPFGNHRGINDEGKPVNMNAGEVFGDFGSLPDISFEVTDSGAPASYEDTTAITSLTVKGANSTGYLTGFTNWTKVENGNSNWTAATATMAAYAITANVKTKDYNNTLELRYWYDGEKVNSIKLNSGVTATVQDFTLDADKILNLQVVVTPLDKTLGQAKTYTYIVYPGSANLKYVHPVIKSLTAKAGDKNLTMSPAWDTAALSYTLDVDGNDTITLDGEQLIKIYNTAITADKSDKVVLTKLNKKGEAIGEPITVFEAGQPNNPNRYWKLENLDITGVDTLQIKVTSYVDETIERTYKIKIKADYKDILDNTLKQLSETVKEPKMGTNGGEWTVLALARGEYFKELKNDYFKGYYNRIKEEVVKLAGSVNKDGALHKNKSTENARVILALSAIGKDPRNVGGVDLVEAYSKNGMSWINKQGINGVIFALISLDTKDFAVTDTTLRETCVKYLLDNQKAGGGWALTGDKSDVDICAMALQALAKYKDNTDVCKAAEKAFGVLSEMQNTDGSFSYGGNPTSESIAQVITACCAWGIDPDTDPRFVKNGVSAVDAILGYYIEDGKGFAHVMNNVPGYTGGEVNAMATDQAAYALVAFDRFKNNKTSLYDMSDVKFVDKVSETIEAVVVEKDKPFEYSVETTGNDTNEAKITIPAAVAESLKDASSMELKTDMGAIVFDKDALNTIFGGNENVEIAMSTNESTDGSIILELTATDSEGNNLFNGQNGGKATVNVKVAAPEGKEDYFVYYVNGDKYEKVKAELNENGELVVELTHFSEYKIMKFILGDVDGEDGVNSFDAMYAYAYFNNPSIIGTDLNLFAADVDGDGEIDSYDAFLIYAYHNGLITSFEEE